ncbi:amino-acid N-acetyltransferase [Streptosporangium sp. NBC_01756]|uniref:amino-acid N-acetyltransferase n=1 Tax=Streptosporangium sp. NBC_01756 TaxID=2975950 RepID=UPI002DDAEA8E|nr:amino-acid N-acetyltransferase [Streptosporangium sp. NBC_01756]WSC89992.1 amino-acid N-acetyltransferase [Streptosporangium sp. NBC_01756]
MEQVAEHSPTPAVHDTGNAGPGGGDADPGRDRGEAGPDPAAVRVRRARTRDVHVIRRLVDTYGGVGRRLLEKATVTLYEDVQEFWVAEQAGTVVGCGALHVLWEDLAEIRTVAVDPGCRGLGIGNLIVSELLRTAGELGLRRVFCLTFEVGFFARHGFREIQGTPVSPEVYAELLASYDEGVAEFLDLEHVKPNTLGNTRMLLHLTQEHH